MGDVGGCALADRLMANAEGEMRTGGARSRREFIAKLWIVEEEADESQFWMDLVIERGWADIERVAALRDEARQLVAIVVASIRTARRTPRSIPHSAFRVSH